MMMKYIRTKDSIYENNGLMQSNSTVEENAIIVCGGHFAIPISKIIKQSDKIEELCDWYVGIDTFGKAHFIETTIPFENVKLCFRGMEIYIAILTSKGLIYVAKVNDKGELELL